MNQILRTTFLTACFFLCLATASAADRPNIVWISLEDIGPMMGCYGDEFRCEESSDTKHHQAKARRS